MPTAGRMADDFAIDENAGIAYLTVYRENTIDCVSLNPARNSDRFLALPDGERRPARFLRVDFPGAPAALRS